MFTNGGHRPEQKSRKLKANPMLTTAVAARRSPDTLQNDLTYITKIRMQILALDIRNTKTKNENENEMQNQKCKMNKCEIAKCGITNSKCEINKREIKKCEN